MRILVVEDEKHLNSLITKKLLKEKYSVDRCYNGNDALDYFYGAEYDAVLLDIMLPGLNGLEVLKDIRSKGNKTPVLLLTAKDTIDDRVTGLDLGADDYLVKPFALEELLARIRLLLRRSSDHVSNTITIADLVIDTNKRRVFRGDSEIELTSREFDILEYMARNCGIVLSRDKIVKHIWNYDYDGVSNVIDVYIRYLRKKIDDGFDIKLLHTKRGAGYVLAEEK
jgi:two-component system copper resistance phosphate regulon response regulator CusR